MAHHQASRRLSEKFGGAARRVLVADAVKSKAPDALTREPLVRSRINIDGGLERRVECGVEDRRLSHVLSKERVNCIDSLKLKAVVDWGCLGTGSNGRPDFWS